jgi:hypothetical protein
MINGLSEDSNMGNGKPGEVMNESLVAVDKEYRTSKGACSKTGKSSVTLKDRAELNTRLSRQGMGNGKTGEEMNESLVAVDKEDTASEEPDRSKTGKSSVTLKDRAEMNVRLSKQGLEKITQQTQWRYEK